MLAKKLAVTSLAILSALTLDLHAQTSQKHILVAPNCLIKKINLDKDIHVISTTSSLSLIATTDNGLEQFIQAKKSPAKTPCGGFINVTAEWKVKNLSAETGKSFLKKFQTLPKTSKNKVTYSIQYSDQVNSLLKLFNPELMWNDLTQFSNTDDNQFPDRYANSDNGVKAAHWLKEKITALAKANNRSDITAYFVATGKQYKQPSLVVKIGNSQEAGIVVGGHMDTLSSSWELKPGADDDGSGSMSVMAVARTLINSGMHFKKPIYIIWYSAEEEGLVGSSYVVKDFVNKKILVDAVLHLDMTGYAYKNDPTVWLVTDYVNKDLTNFLSSLVKTYVKQPVGFTECGYACSDHASWNKAGFKSSFPFESSFDKDNPYIHTAQDTPDVLSINHMSDYTKLGIAFAVELAQPIV